mgnify:CR=1 FL=1
MEMFKSNEELFQTTRTLIELLEQRGESAASKELQIGLSSLNGLTDGWADFLSSIAIVKKKYTRKLTQPEIDLLKLIYESAYLAVYRQNPSPWWKFWAR